MKKYINFSLILLAGFFLVGCQSYSDNSGSIKGETTNNKKEIVDTEAIKNLEKDELFKGSENAQITLIELADFECPACKNYFQDIKKFTDEYKDKVKFIYLHYPLSYHPNAMEAALAFEAAAKQNKAWEMYDELYSVDKLESESIKQSAEKIGLNMNKFETDKNLEELKSKIQNHMQKAQNINLTGTPTFFLNNEPVEFNPTYENLKEQVEQIINSN